MAGSSGFGVWAKYSGISRILIGVSAEIHEVLDEIHEVSVFEQNIAF